MSLSLLSGDHSSFFTFSLLQHEWVRIHLLPSSTFLLNGGRCIIFSSPLLPFPFNENKKEDNVCIFCCSCCWLFLICFLYHRLLDVEFWLTFSYFGLVVELFTWSSSVLFVSQEKQRCLIWLIPISWKGEPTWSVKSSAI